MNLIFFSSNFCEPCMATRAGIRSIPTVVVLGQDGSEVFRAEGVPTLNQVLVALAKAV